MAAAEFVNAEISTLLREGIGRLSRIWVIDKKDKTNRAIKNPYL